MKPQARTNIYHGDEFARSEKAMTFGEWIEYGRLVMPGMYFLLAQDNENGTHTVYEEIWVGNSTSYSAPGETLPYTWKATHERMSKRIEEVHSYNKKLTI